MVPPCVTQTIAFARLCSHEALPRLTEAYANIVNAHIAFTKPKPDLLTQQERILPGQEKRLQRASLSTHEERPTKAIRNQFRKKLARSPVKGKEVKRFGKGSGMWNECRREGCENQIRIRRKDVLLLQHDLQADF